MEKGAIRHGNVETLPRFIRHLRDLRCCDGDAITLECHVEGLPEPAIIWEKDGRVLPSVCTELRMSYDGIKATLSIPRVYPEDEGEYTCVAKNNIGRTLSSACIIVDVPEEKENMLHRQLSRPLALLSACSTPRSTPRSTPCRSFSPLRHHTQRHSCFDSSGNLREGSASTSSSAGPYRRYTRTHTGGTQAARQAISAPKFLAIPHSRVVEEGDSVRFQCAIRGNPMPWSTWDKDGLIITPTARIVPKEVDDLRFLEIDEVGFDDAGLYRITLENDYGRIEATARLDVISSSRYSRSPSGRSVRATSSSHRNGAYMRRRIRGPSTAIGGRMALASGFRGSSVPSCRFYRDGLELTESERIHIHLNEEEEEAYLVVDQVTWADEGLYSCVIEGVDHAPLVSTTRVKFYATPEELERSNAERRPPQIVRPLPEEVCVAERETVDLSFELDCEGPYTYEWTRDGEPLPDGDEFSHIDHGNGVLCLRIHDAFDLDSGCYACRVRTADGRQTCETVGQLTVLDADSGCFSGAADEGDNDVGDCVASTLTLLKSPLPVLAFEGDEAVFCARIHPSDALTTWFVCGRPVVVDDVVAADVDADCAAGFDESRRGVALESSPVDGLRILRLRNLRHAHSGEVQLSVTHPGRRGQAPSSSLRAYTSLYVLPGPATPSTEAVEDDDAPNNNNNTEAAIPAAQPARILSGPEDCTVLIGGSVRLRVEYEAEPQPRIGWFKGCRPIAESSSEGASLVRDPHFGATTTATTPHTTNAGKEDVDDDAHISIRTMAGRSELRIARIAADDSGKYTVEVTNAHGSDMAAASVAVEGPPDPPGGRPSVSLGPDRAAVAWCGPPYDGGCMITGFTIEMQEVPTNLNETEEDVLDEGLTKEWHAIATVVDSLAYTVKDLSAGRSYRFRVRAENVHGRSEPSRPSEAVTVAGPTKPKEVIASFTPIRIADGGDFRSRFDLLEELGKGRFGVVYKVHEKAHPERPLAAKVIKCIKALDRQKVQEEVAIMRSLQHPKLLQLAAAFESPREIVMVMEYITGGELFERVVADDFTLTELDCILFLRQVCEGVAYMHSQRIVHLDLKPENIMCHTRTSHQIKIIDFGLAQRLSGDAPVRVLFGTPEFIPPEVISYEPIGFQSDMWSVGVICYVLLSGLSPFMGDSDVDTFTNITRADYDFDDEAFDCVSEEAKDFIAHLLLHRKEERWTAVECLASTWLTHTARDADSLLSNNRICTDKLKKFIIRRKWQKTGNAIRALGRMATLSASRRNSAVSTPPSPRPSISGPAGALAAPTQMSSLHEEETEEDADSSALVATHSLSPRLGQRRPLEQRFGRDSARDEGGSGDVAFSIELPAWQRQPPNLKALKQTPPVLRVRDGRSQCSERSDSGYSECSTCSAGGGVGCQCPGRRDREHADAQEEDEVERSTTTTTTLLSIAVPHEVLKTKLEQIAGRACEEPPLPPPAPPPPKAAPPPPPSSVQKAVISTPALKDTRSTSPPRRSPSRPREGPLEEPAHRPSISPDSHHHPRMGEEMPTSSSGSHKAPIMRSDFTNTITMRKKSLENSATREKVRQQPKVPLQHDLPPGVGGAIAGKVSLLKNKFSAPSGGGEEKCAATTKATAAHRQTPIKMTTTGYNNNNNNKNNFDKNNFNNSNNNNNKNNIGDQPEEAARGVLGSHAREQNTAAITPPSPQQQSFSASMPTSPQSVRSNIAASASTTTRPGSRSPPTGAALRLSGRVREATERLAQQQTISSASRNALTLSPGLGRRPPPHNAASSTTMTSSTAMPNATVIVVTSSSSPPTPASPTSTTLTPAASQPATPTLSGRRLQQRIAS